MSLTINCPICGERNGYEFLYGGEEKGQRPEDRELGTPESWCNHVHMNRSIAGVQEEWWCHRDGCGAWFSIHRDTTRNIEVSRPNPENPEV